MNNDHIYWLFSAAAQCISAFIAFILAGYALVHNLMEAVRDKDDTLEEIHLSLRKKYHSRLTWMTWVTGFAILLSLASVFLNRWEFSSKVYLLGLTTMIDLLAVILGLSFVISIVNPSRYEKTAIKVLKEKKAEMMLAGESTASDSFFNEFRRLERLMRDYLKKRDLYIPSKGAPRMSFSFRQMVEALHQNEKIDQQFYEQLIQINKYRNLVFHGHVDQADRAMLERVGDAASKVERLS